VTMWKSVKALPRTLAKRELAVASRQCTVWHYFFNQGSFDQKHDCHHVSSIEDKTERLPFWHNWGDRGRNHRRCSKPS
jgi:hypothetical protein